MLCIYTRILFGKHVGAYLTLEVPEIQTQAWYSKDGEMVHSRHIMFGDFWRTM